MNNVWKKAMLIVLVSSIIVTAAGPKGGPVIVRITGEIDEIFVDWQLIVSDQLVQATDDTVITITLNKVKTVITFDDLELYMTVRVCGEIIDGVLVAKKINVMYGGL